jgi:hypothetical protein
MQVCRPGFDDEHGDGRVLREPCSQDEAGGLPIDQRSSVTAYAVHARLLLRHAIRSCPRKRTPIEAHRR